MTVNNVQDTLSWFAASEEGWTGEQWYDFYNQRINDMLDETKYGNDEYRRRRLSGLSDQIESCEHMNAEQKKELLAVIHPYQA